MTQELAESWAREFCEACPELPPGAIAVVTQLLASFSAAALRSSRQERDAARAYLIRNVLQPLHPNIKAAPDLIGVCTQVDNVTAGLREERDAAVAARDVAQQICGEAYQAVGVLAHCLGLSDHPDVIRLMDNLAYHDDPPHGDLLPWPKDDALIEKLRALAASSLPAEEPQT